MSDFEQWYSNALAEARANGDKDLHKALCRNVGHYKYGFEAAIASMQGEAVGVVTLADDIAQPDTSGEHKGKYQNMIYSSAPLQVGAHVYTHSPDSAARIAELQTDILNCSNENVSLCDRIAEQDAEIARLTKELEEARKNSERIKGLRSLCGYVEDGSSMSVTLFQDDVTKEWFVKQGSALNPYKTVYSDSFTGAIDASLNIKGGAE